MMTSASGTSIRVFPCTCDTSEDAEFWALIQFLRSLPQANFTGHVGICIDNSQVVKVAKQVLSSNDPPPSTSGHGTWYAAIKDLILYLPFQWFP